MTMMTDIPGAKNIPCAKACTEWGNLVGAPVEKP
jgi:hypothetical protein